MTHHSLHGAIATGAMPEIPPNLVPLTSVTQALGGYFRTWRLYHAGELGGYKVGGTIFVDKERVAAVSRPQ